MEDGTAAAVDVAVLDVPAEPVAPQHRTWWLWLGALSLLGLALRVAAVLGRPHEQPAGDSAFFYYSAKLLVHGKAFINPFIYNLPDGAHLQVPNASWPPLFTFVMAVPQAVGLSSFFAGRLWLCVVGTAAVVLVAFAGREIAGWRTGLVAGALVAVSPNLWMTSDLGMSETLTPLLVGWILWMAYRFWKRPTTATAVWMGVSLGVSMMGRDELSLLSVLIFVPLALLATALSWRRRLTLLAIGALCAMAVVAPWVAYNNTRFANPVFISNGLGITLASANCPSTYSGFRAGYWDFACSLSTPIKNKTDESIQGAEAQSYALSFMSAHASELPQVEVDRVGRTFALFRPAQQIWFDATYDGRPYHWAMAGLGMYYLLVVGSLAGTVVLRRRRIPSFPLWAVGLNVLLASMLTFGNTRFRVSFEVSLILLSAVAIDVALGRALARRAPRGALEKRPEPPSA